MYVYFKRLGAGNETEGSGVGDTMFTSYTSGCHGRQAASPLVLILQQLHGAVAMVTSSRECVCVWERKRGVKRKRQRKVEEEERNTGERDGETVTFNSPSHPQRPLPLPNSFITMDSTNCVSRSYRSLQGDVVKCCDWSFKPEGWLLGTGLDKKIKVKFYDCQQIPKFPTWDSNYTFASTCFVANRYNILTGCTMHYMLIFNIQTLVYKKSIYSSIYTNKT